MTFFRLISAIVSFAVAVNATFVKGDRVVYKGSVIQYTGRMLEQNIKCWITHGTKGVIEKGPLNKSGGQTCLVIFDFCPCQGAQGAHNIEVELLDKVDPDENPYMSEKTFRELEQNLYVHYRSILQYGKYCSRAAHESVPPVIQALIHNFKKISIGYSDIALSSSTRQGVSKLMHVRKLYQDIVDKAARLQAQVAGQLKARVGAAALSDQEQPPQAVQSQVQAAAAPAAQRQQPVQYHPHLPTSGVRQVEAGSQPNPSRTPTQQQQPVQFRHHLGMQKLQADRVRLERELKQSAAAERRLQAQRVTSLEFENSLLRRRIQQLEASCTIAAMRVFAGAAFQPAVEQAKQQWDGTRVNLYILGATVKSMVTQEQWKKIKKVSKHRNLWSEEQWQAFEAQLPKTNKRPREADEEAPSQELPVKRERIGIKEEPGIKQEIKQEP